MANFQFGKPTLLDAMGQPINQGESVPAGIALPHSWTFISKYSGSHYTYLHHLFDEAMRHAREDAEAMRRDCYLMSLLQERQLAVASLPWHLEVPDEKDKYQLRVRDGITRIVKGIPIFRRMIAWWLEALWYGKYGVQIEWDWCEFHDREVEDLDEDGEADGGDTADPKMGMAPGMPGMAPGMLPSAEPKKNKKKPKKGKMRRGLTVGSAWPVNGDKIGHQHDHTPYILVNSGEIDRIPQVDQIVTSLGRAISLRGTWRERFIIHKHLMEDVDYFSGDQAEAVHGVGIRSKLFWHYWLKMEWLGNITDFFDRVGLGITIWKYPRGNAEAKRAVETAARDQSNRSHIFVPVDPDNMGNAGTGVDRVEVPTSGADALSKLIDLIDKYLERYVVGQEGSSSGSASGIGNEANAEFQMDTKSRITMQDAAFLAETITGTDSDPGLINTIKQYTFPKARFPVKFVFDVERKESESKLNAAKTLVDLGLKLKADEVRAAAGFSKPAEGDELVEPPQQPGPGGPGGPGGPPGGPGGDPMAALMGGGGPPGGPPDGPPPGGDPMAGLMGGGGPPPGETPPGGPPPGGPPPGEAPADPNNPLDALLAGGGPPGGEAPESPPQAEKEKPEGDFLDAFKSGTPFMRLSRAVKYFRARNRDDIAEAILNAYARRQEKR